MTKKLKSKEPKRILHLGESLRENSKTILLSIPVFTFGLCYYSMISDKEGLAGAYGHMGIAFKNYHKHFWKKRFLLEIAYYLFRKAAELGGGKDRPTVLLKCGQTALELGDKKSAEKNYNEAIAEAKRLKDKYQKAYVSAHLADLIKEKDFEKAEGMLTNSHEVLNQAIDKNPEALYFQIWISFVELALGQLYLSKADKNSARVWAEKAHARVEKYDLKVRKLDVKKLLSKIESTARVFILAFLG